MDILSDCKIKEIEQIIKDCEEVQDSHESAYTKQQEKISAYNNIKTLLNL